MDQKEKVEAYRVFLAGCALTGEMTRTVIHQDGRDLTVEWDNSEKDECAEKCVEFANAVLRKLNINQGG